jgi:hypothetical protein
LPPSRHITPKQSRQSIRPNRSAYLCSRGVSQSKNE